MYLFYLNNTTGHCYESGRGVEIDSKRAVDYYYQAAQRGHARAMCNLGVMHEVGRGVQKDERKAVTLYFLASMSQKERFRCLEMFQEEAMSATFAIANEDTYVFSGEGSLALAKYYLGLCYQDGIGLSADKRTARKWFRRAAEAGSAVGMNALGVYLMNGWGGSREELEAAEWYRKAASLGSLR